MKHLTIFTKTESHHGVQNEEFSILSHSDQVLLQLQELWTIQWMKNISNFHTQLQCESCLFRNTNKNVAVDVIDLSAVF